MLAFQDRIAVGDARPGGGRRADLRPAPIALLAYGAFFLLGFTLYALIYAAVGSFVSRPDDLQTLSLPLSLLRWRGTWARFRSC